MTAQADLINFPGLIVKSLVSSGDFHFGAVRANGTSQLAVSGHSLQGFEGETIQHGDHTLLLCSVTPANLTQLRQHLPWLIAKPLGLQTSAGMGDRLGLATPGHVRAIRGVGGTIAPIFAQQSMREMLRTQRIPQQVMDDAVWGVFTEGWRDGFGADADHLKTTADIDNCANVGFTFFTIDPSEHVDHTSETANAGELKSSFDRLPWLYLEDSPADLHRRYLSKAFQIEDHTVGFTEEALVKAAAKYGRAIAHVAMMHRHLTALSLPTEMEISVDETEFPTTHAEHI